MQRLALFDLDHTLLDGDSDQLWIDFLLAEGLLERAAFDARNQEMARGYQAGTVDVRAFCEFYIGTLTLMPRAAWQPLRERFLAEWIVPRLAAQGIAQVRAHAAAGDLVVLTTATNRFITELTARQLGIGHLIATETEMLDQGKHFSGKAEGVLNMRAGKVERLHAWLAGRGLELAACDSTAYSDSMNDLPLLDAVRTPVAAQPDARLRALATERGWKIVDWFRGSAKSDRDPQRICQTASTRSPARAAASR